MGFFPVILKHLYDSDIVEEEAMLMWAGESGRSEEFTPPALSDEQVAALRAKAAPFVTWLEEADEEEGDDDDDDDEVGRGRRGGKEGRGGVSEAAERERVCVLELFFVHAFTTVLFLLLFCFSGCCVSGRRRGSGRVSVCCVQVLGYVYIYLANSAFSMDLFLWWFLQKSKSTLTSAPLSTPTPTPPLRFYAVCRTRTALKLAVVVISCASSVSTGPVRFSGDGLIP